MATPVQFAVTAIDPDGTPDVAYDGTGATLEGSNLLQVTYDADSFTAAEGKIRLVNALQRIMEKILRPDTTWPAS